MLRVFPAVQLITDKAQDPLPQLVASEVSGKMVAARKAGL